MDADHSALILDLAWLIATQITELGLDSSWVERDREINKVSLHFVVKIWWVIVRHRLSSAFADNIFTWDRISLISILISGYDIEFDRWSKLRSMREYLVRPPLFSLCLIQYICDATRVPPILEVDQQIEMTHMADTAWLWMRKIWSLHLECNHLLLQVWPISRGLLFWSSLLRGRIWVLMLICTIRELSPWLLLVVRGPWVQLH